MNTPLLLITLVSVGTTAAVLLYAMRLVREERERSEARVVALSDAIAEQMRCAPEGPDFRLRAQRYGETRRSRAEAVGPAGMAPLEGRPPSGVATEPNRGVNDAGDGLPERPEPANSRSGALATPPIAAAADLRIAPQEPFDDLEPASSPLMFGGGDAGTSRHRTWLLAPLAGALVVLALIGGVYATSSHPSAPPAATKAEGGPLELVSLRHVRKGNELTISGLVRNPPDGTRQADVTAVVFLFDRTGSFIRGARAPLDYRQLAAGDESPFVVTVPNAGAVARYRVSFRTERDIVPHVDRRARAVETGAP